ncbi:MAG: hypothetical protein IBJ03_09165 [Gemmatimonadaceae bacterium]|nr:hypothetical protein [Gemmatimonadaceae bacterium]
MANFKLIHRGIGLWIDHKTDWTVYFPVAEKQLAPQPSKFPPFPHVPTLHFTARHYIDSNKFSERFEVSLSNAIVSFEGLQEIPNAKLTAGEYLLPIKTTPTSPTRDRDTAHLHQYIWGLMTIPRSHIDWHPGNHMIKVKYRKKEYHKRWSAMSFNCFRAKDQPLVLIVKDIGTGTEVRYPIAADDDLGDVKVELKVMSPIDRIPKLRDPTDVDSDFSANHLVATGTPAQVATDDLPEIFHKKIREKAATDDHLCSGAYGCDPATDPTCT